MPPDDISDALDKNKNSRPPTEVLAKPSRRTFTAQYKLRILQELDAAPPGGQGEILRREGLYSSHVCDWRRQALAGACESLARTRGPKPERAQGQTRKIAELEREIAKLQEELRKAQLIVEVQGKLAGLLGIDLNNGKPV